MKLLCVGNGSFTKKGGKLLTGEHHVWEFLRELSVSFTEISFLQIARDNGFDEAVNSFGPGSDAVHLVSIRVNGQSTLRKVLYYLIAVFPIVRHVKNADYLYLFVPGALPFVAAVCARVLGRSYGVYLRGEYGLTSTRVRWILSNADFVQAEGCVLADKARALCRDVELTIPMFDLTIRECVTNREFKMRPPWEILYVGRVEAQKGTRELVAAARILRRQGVDFTLNIVGDGEDLEGLKKESEKAMEGYIRYIGLIVSRERLFSLYRSADLFVLPSHNEGFPRVLYEAMVFHIPIVTTFVGSIPSLMEHGVNCVRARVGDPTDLASQIMTTLHDGDLRRRIACNGSRTIRDLLGQNEGRSLAGQVCDRVGVHAKATRVSA